MTMSKNKILQEIKSLLMVLIIAIFIRTILFEPFYIPSSSMEPTLREGDYVFATKYDYGFSKYSLSPFTFDIFSGRILEKQVEVGDIVIFRPPNNMEIRYIKRLIGKPSDKIQMIHGDLYINDKLVIKKHIGQYTDKQGTSFKHYREKLPNGLGHDIISLDMPDKLSSRVFQVPEGHYFFMGDNRDNSLDSRFGLGFVPAENIIAKAKIIHFSTDYIFDGLKEGSYSENDKALPLSIYGKSKWLGEEAVRKFNPKHLILRTSWVFSKNGRNFLRTIMRLSQEKDKLNVVNDQIGAPTSVSVISAAVLKMIISINENKNLYGTYHLTCSGETTWYKYSKEIINYLNSLGITTKLTYDSLLPMINLGQDTLRAERPLNSRLNTEKIKKTFNLELPFWKDEVERVIREIVNK
jgi:signal peptidase I